MLNIIGAANPAERKYFEGPAFSGLPAQVRQEVKALCAMAAERIGCVFLLGMDEEGQVQCQTVSEDAINFDEIGAELVVKEVVSANKELFSAITCWYALQKEV